MKKKVFLMALVGAALTACSNHDFETWSEGEIAQSKYEAAFIKRFGQPAPNHTWGFGDVTRSGMTRSAANPEVLGIDAPYTEAWVAEYLNTAKEPNSTNVSDNYDNSKAGECQWYANGGGKLDKLIGFYHYGNQSDAYTAEDKTWADNNIKDLLEKYEYYNWNTSNEAAYSILKKLQEYKSEDPNYDYKTYWNLTVNKDGGLIPDEDFVLNFKITGTWDGNIDVLGRGENETARTVVVTGLWNLTESQSMGVKGRIIVANGGEIKISAGCTINSSNAAQIVVLRGGKITGEGAIALHNGTRNDMPSYNGGIIDVAKFNNNGGDFFNYGTLKANVMEGGAGNSCYYNHSVININKCESSNVRLFNNCQFYCATDMRIRNYEGVQSSSLICGGQLMCSGSMDGTSDASYVTLDNGALIQCGTLYNNGTSWSGPTATNEYAVLDITEKITYLNWEQDAPQNGGYFANNLYVSAGTWENTDVDGNGVKGWTAGQKFEIVKNATGNGNTTIIEKSNDPNDVIIPSDDFVAGVSGCTPGFNGKTPEDPDPTPSGDIRVIAEDLTVDERGDFDFNDVVFDIILKEPAGKTTIILRAAGGTLPLRVAGHEVHAEFGVATNVMVNTGSGVEKAPVTFIVDGELNADGVIVEVQKDGQWIELKADRGRVPCKIAVDCDYDWCSERQDIEKKYPMFKEYVGNPNLVWYK